MSANQRRTPAEQYLDPKPHFGVTQDDQIRESSSLPRDHFAKLATPPLDRSTFERYIAGLDEFARKIGATQDNSDLRDRFAMAALTGILADSPTATLHPNLSNSVSIEAAAGAAYKFADSMILARKQ